VYPKYQFLPLCHKRYGSVASTNSIATDLFRATEFRHSYANAASTIGVATISQQQESSLQAANLPEGEAARWTAEELLTIAHAAALCVTVGFAVYDEMTPLFASTTKGNKEDKRVRGAETRIMKVVLMNDWKKNCALLRKAGFLAAMGPHHLYILYLYGH
jgi:hypothetical protein